MTSCGAMNFINGGGELSRESTLPNDEKIFGKKTNFGAKIMDFGMKMLNLDKI